MFHNKLISKKALKILNSGNGLVEKPTLESGGNDFVEYLVASDRGRHYNVKVKHGTKVVCSSKGFKYSKLCSHSVAVAEKKRILRNLIDNIKVGNRTQLTFPLKKSGSGRKGGKQRYTMDKHSKSQPSSIAHPKENNGSPFSEVWHNNKPLVLCLIHTLPKGSLCYQCGVEFPSGSLLAEPFDIALKHEERWKYPNKVSSSPKFLTSAKMTTKYYCVRKQCVMERFPYFNAEFLDQSEVILEDSHKKHIRDHLEITL